MITKAPILKDNKSIFTCVHIVRNVKQMNIKDVSVDFLFSLVTPGKVNLMYIGLFMGTTGSLSYCKHAVIF